MRDVYVVADNIYSPLGSTTRENFDRLLQGRSAVQRHDRQRMAEQPFYAALFDSVELLPAKACTPFERLLIASSGDALQRVGLATADERTILIVSSTKGNIGLLEADVRMPPSRLSLFVSAALVGRHFGFVNPPIVISNACISGVLALLTALRLLRSGRYDNAVVTGADLITQFVLSGFNSFQALSPGHCRPFDEARDGINLGEGAATIILSARPEYQWGLRLRGGAVSNDANHISGPSRTGRELAEAIQRALADAGATAMEIGYVSAHGTATDYNDEMEAKAITLAGLEQVPVNSLKGYYGHTLGAAGLIESVVALQCLREELVLPSKGFQKSGVTTPLNVCTSLMRVPLNTCLKTASGFGGCNAALVLGK
jgi:3-oxoacyl-[acyl-carrier-protein] synthase I